LGSGARATVASRSSRTSGYDEATQILTRAYNLFLGGSCIEDIGTSPITPL